MSNADCTFLKITIYHVYVYNRNTETVGKNKRCQRTQNKSELYHYTILHCDPLKESRTKGRENDGIFRCTWPQVSLANKPQLFYKCIVVTNWYSVPICEQKYPSTVNYKTTMFPKRTLYSKRWMAEGRVDRKRNSARDVSCTFSAGHMCSNLTS